MNVVTITRPQLGFNVSEAYKALRANLLFCGKDKKTIAITSCLENEGKSTVSLNLALSLADSGKKVLFVDADLRKSVMLRKTKTREAVWGLSHLLSGQETINNVICATNVPNFHIIYAGITPPNPAELLGGEYFKQILAAVRKAYDYVIVDTPPIGSAIDGAVVAQECDGSILVIESAAVGYRFAWEVREQLERSGSPILGVILNKIDGDRQNYYGKYYGTYADNKNRKH